MSKSSLEQLLKKRDEQLLEYSARINELEDLVEELEALDMGVIFTDAEKTMVKIIVREINRLNDESKVNKLDKDDTKKFDTLVKDFVAIRGKLPKKKGKPDEIEEKTVAELLELA